MPQLWSIEKNKPLNNPLPYKKSIKVIGLTFLIYALLVATHLGEFWPFSIYPMFSQAGNPWSRSIVREIPRSDDPDKTIAWTAVDADNLPGLPVALDDHGVDPIDLANFVSKTEKWDNNRVEGLRNMFRADELGLQQLLIFRAIGAMNEADSVVLSFEPYVLVNQEGALVNPGLNR